MLSLGAVPSHFSILSFFSSPLLVSSRQINSTISLIKTYLHAALHTVHHFIQKSAVIFLQGLESWAAAILQTIVIKIAKVAGLQISSANHQSETLRTWIIYYIWPSANVALCGLAISGPKLFGTCELKTSAKICEYILFLHKNIAYNTVVQICTQKNVYKDEI